MTEETREFLTVRELAELLRIRERKVYDLAASGEVPVSRVTGKLLFPERAIRDWIASGSSGGETVRAPAIRPPEVLLGSHDPLLEWAVRQSRAGLAMRCEGSLDGLSRFAAGEGVATGLHLRDPETGDWNTARVAQAFSGRDVVLVAWTRRSRGIVWRSGGGAPIRSVADLAGRRVVPRAPETGTQTLFDDLLAREGLTPGALKLTDTAPTENDAVMAVAQGAADATFGLEAVARLFGLDFLPVVEERFDLLVDRRAWFDPPLQRLFAFCRSDSFGAHAADIAGCDTAELGQVRWNA
ncbi:helix-turn-helix transcriptional regulator [Roseivivax isoporae]|uniref:Excisionase n=1 Tax=Roseivivax isoporae LMG 25204 TaxID=1449351 RepID=X7F4M0_9RHOB|nr:helix-turn-helix transcriptional regulator [Roseivivax isoporae]ETX27872.1 excisionase [Roseivivax isoporae LMG 25204]